VKALHEYVVLFKQAQNPTNEKIPSSDLRWTEEMTFQLYSFDEANKVARLAADAQQII